MKNMSIVLLLMCASVFADTDIYVPVHNSRYVHVFSFDGSELTRTATLEAPSVSAYGACDIAIDKESGSLFVANEGTTALTLFSSRDLNFIKNITTSTPNGTGIEYDAQRERIYMTTRNQNKLYVYDWDGIAKTLTETNFSPVTLANITYACGLALDGDTLYVSEYHYAEQNGYYNTVQEYDVANNFQHVNTQTMEHNVVGITCDTVDDYLYGGAYGSYVFYLDKHDIQDPNYDTYEDISAVPVGLEVSQETGHLFATTTTGSTWALEVWDTSDWPNSGSDPIDSFSSDSEVTLTSLCGICVVENGYKDGNIYVNKTDNIDPNEVGCQIPGDEIDYTIYFNAAGENHTNVKITDFLPKGVDFVSADPNTAEYDIFKHTVSWDVGNLTPTDPNTPYTLSVVVNQAANPTFDLINVVEIESDSAWAQDSDNTPVCCWEDDSVNTPGVVYVDANADPNVTMQNGTSWDSAYYNLTDAIDRINNARDQGIECGTEIWVAHGTYSPGDGLDDTYAIPDDIEVYGGFIGNETLRTDRNWVKYKTILSGYVETSDNNLNVVIMGDETLLDGFVVKDADENGIKGDSVDFTIANCIVKDNGERAIYCEDSDVTIDSCVVRNNNLYGIHHKGSNNTLTISGSKVFGNLRHGVFCENSTPTITNCMIYDNGSEGSNYYGINLYAPSSSATLRNNTIAFNTNYGISYSGSNAPVVTNTILWGNNSNETLQIQAVSGCDITYSCVQDPNITSDVPDANYNIHIDPNFAYGDADENFNFHLSDISPCIDKGYNTGVGIDEVDIDGETRIAYGLTSSTVDIGADEYVTCSDGVSHEYDLNADGIINLYEYGELAELWLLDSTDTGWNETWDLDDDDVINIDDLTEFMDIWLWSACWHDVTPMAMMSTMSSFMMEPLMLESETYSDVYSDTIYVDLAEASELPLEAQLYQIGQIIEWMESLPTAYPEMMGDINMDDLNEFLEKLYAEELRLLEAIEARDNLTTNNKVKKDKHK